MTCAWAAIPVDAFHVVPWSFEYHTDVVSAVAHTIDEPSGATAMVPPPLMVPDGTPAKGVHVNPASVEMVPNGATVSVARTTVDGVACSKSIELGVACGVSNICCGGLTVRS